MALSGRDLAWYVETGKLKINPILPEQYQQNGIDLILEDVEPRYERDGHKETKFYPVRFYLGCTRETLEFPDDLMAWVELRSTWARSGLIIPPTIVDAGFKGNLTLEIVAFKSLDIPFGQRFAHLVFDKLSSPSVPYGGKYSGQSGITRPIPDK